MTGSHVTAMRTVCFFSDFGVEDASAGVCRAVIARLEPGVSVIDITHGLPQRDVLAGAIVLRDSVPYLPAWAVCLAVVDPGVGGTRRAVVLRSRDDRLFVGPDNGLLLPAAEVGGGITEAVELTNEETWLRPLSSTFHGRDVFAPAASRLAAGLALRALGTVIDPTTLVRLALPAPRWSREGVVATVTLLDSFGNVLLNVNGEELATLPAKAFWVQCAAGTYAARAARTYSEVPSGGLAVLVDGSGAVAVAANGASAAHLLGLAARDEIMLRWRKE